MEEEDGKDIFTSQPLSVACPSRAEDTSTLEVQVEKVLTLDQADIKKLISTCVAQNRGDLLISLLQKVFKSSKKRKKPAAGLSLSQAVRPSQAQEEDNEEEEEQGKLPQEAKQDLQFVMVSKILKFLHLNALPDKHASPLVAALAEVIERLRPGDMLQLVERLLKGLTVAANPGKELSLLPKAMRFILHPSPERSASQTIDCSPISMDNMLPSDYKEYVVNKITQSKWVPEVVLAVVIMLEDMDLSANQHAILVKKALRHLEGLDINQLPVLAHHLFILSLKGSLGLVLRSLVSHIQSLEGEMEGKSKSSSRSSSASHIPPQFLEVQGTILLHFNFAAKQDPSLGPTLIGLVRKQLLKMGPFCLAALLAIAPIQRHEKEILTFLKGEVLDALRRQSMRLLSPWLQRTYDKYPAMLSDIYTIVAEVVQQSSHGWDDIVRSLVELGFQLLDTKVASSSLLGLSSQKSATDTSSIWRLAECPSPALSPELNAVGLGARVLSRAFKTHKMVRSVILEGLLFRVMSDGPSAYPATFVLAQVVTHASQEGLVDAELLALVSAAAKRGLDYLAFLSDDVAIEFFKALAPILRGEVDSGLSSRRPLTDYAVLVLRKAMFSREVRSRLIAVNCFLSLAHNVCRAKVEASSSSSSSSTTSLDIASSQSFSQGGAGDMNKHDRALLLEIMGFLRRALTQEHEVRVLLYQGFANLFSQHQELRSVVFDLLRPQFLKYHDEEGDVPMEIPQCFMRGEDDIPRVTEPLPTMVLTIIGCLVTSPGTVHASASEQELQNKVPRVVELLAECDLKKSFQLSQELPFSQISYEGASNLLTVHVLAGLTEAAMEYVLRRSSRVEKNDLVVLEKLFALHCQLFEMIEPKKKDQGKKKKQQADGDEEVEDEIASEAKSAKKAKGKKSITPTQQGSVRCHLSPQGVTTLLELAASDRALVGSLESPAFHMFVMQATGHLVEQISEAIWHHCHGPFSAFGDQKSTATEIEGLSKSLVTGLFALLLRYCEMYPSKKPKRGKKLQSLVVQAAHNLYTLVDLFSFRGVLKVAGLLADVECARPEVAATPEDTALHRLDTCLKSCRDLVTGLIADHPADAEAVLQLMRSLALPLLNHNTSLAGRLSAAQGAWAHQVCVDQGTTNPSLAVALVDFWLLLYSKTMMAMMDLGQDLRALWGAVHEGEAEVPEEASNAVLCEATVEGVALLLIERLHVITEHVVWLLQGLKRMVTKSDSSVDDANQAKMQKALQMIVFARLTSVVSILGNYCQTQLSNKAADAFLKVAVLVYKTLETTTKLVLQCKHEPPDKFQRLVQHTADDLNQHVYPFIEYLQNLRSNTEKATKAAIRKELSVIPNLIFRIERFEQSIQKLSQFSKVDLARHFKISTSRDFRLETATASRLIKEAQDQDEERAGGKKKKKKRKKGEEKEEEEQEDDDGSPKNLKKKSKKRKKGEEEEEQEEGEVDASPRPASRKGKSSRRSRAASSSKDRRASGGTSDGEECKPEPELIE